MRVLLSKFKSLLIIPIILLVSCYSGVKKTEPQITLSEINEISFDSAKVTLNILSNGGDSIIYSGICWSRMPNPTDSLDLSIRNNEELNTFISNLTNLIPGTTYYVRAYAKNSVGISFSEEKKFTTSILQIGSNYQGGKVGYIFQRGDDGYIEGEVHGLIIAYPSIDWFYYNGQPHENTFADLGQGYQNSKKIYEINKKSPAAWCLNLNLNGYNDWYLPSIMELMKIYYNKTILGLNNYTAGFLYDRIGLKQRMNLPTTFWSSTESDMGIWTLILSGRGDCNGELCTNDFITKTYLRCHWMNKAPYNRSGNNFALILPMRTF